MFLLCPLLLGLAPAFAETPSTLAWSWPFGEVSRWHLETTYVAPRGLVFSAANAQGQVQQARAARTDLPGILETLSADLRGGTVEVVQSPDGRIVSFDLQGLVRTNLASGAIIDQDRALLQRAFCGFELPLPKAGVVHPWKDAGTSALMTLQTSTGTTGTYELSYAVQPLLDDVVAVVTTGGGTLSYGSAMDSGTSDRPDRTVTMAAGGSPAGLSYLELSVRGDQVNFDGGARIITTQVTGVAAFDPTGSRVTWRKINLDGRQTASESRAAPVGGDQGVAAGRRRPGAKGYARRVLYALRAPAADREDADGRRTARATDVDGLRPRRGRRDRGRDRGARVQGVRGARWSV